MSDDPVVILDAVIAALTNLKASIAPAGPTAAVIVTPADFDKALAAAAPGATLLLDPTLVYPSPLTLATPIRLQAAIDLPTGRMTPDVKLPIFAGSITVSGDDVSLVGLEIRSVDLGWSVVTISGARTLVDRCRILGDPTRGAHRGIAANGNGNVMITRCYVEDCFGPYPGDDTQAICAWDMANGLVIEDNYLSGGSETIMLGGADSSSVDRMPSDVTIRGNTITKRAAWQGQPVNVKNALEIKAGRRVLIANNEISGSWGGHGQDGYALMLTVRNQGGKAPWSTIQDVTVTGNHFSQAAAAINILGRDDRANIVSAPLQHVSITNNVFDGLDAKKYTGSAKMIQIGWGPDAVTIDGNTFTGTGMTSQVYFQGPVPPQCTSLQITNNRWPKTTYGIFASGVTNDQKAAWAKYVASGSHDGNTEVTA